MTKTAKKAKKPARKTPIVQVSGDMGKAFHKAVEKEIAKHVLRAHR